MIFYFIYLEKKIQQKKKYKRIIFVIDCICKLHPKIISKFLINMSVVCRINKKCFKSINYLAIAEWS